jgi:hypothetical protein
VALVFSKRDLPYGFGVSAEEIIQKNYKVNSTIRRKTV